MVPARALGLRTGSVRRPLEFGPGKEPHRPAPDAFDITARSFPEMARKLGG